MTLTMDEMEFMAKVGDKWCPYEDSDEQPLYGHTHTMAKENGWPGMAGISTIRFPSWQNPYSRISTYFPGRPQMALHIPRAAWEDLMEYKELVTYPSRKTYVSQAWLKKVGATVAPPIGVIQYGYWKNGRATWTLEEPTEYSV